MLDQQVPKSIEEAQPPPEPVLYGTEVKLEHVNTRARLHAAEGETCAHPQLTPLALRVSLHGPDCVGESITHRFISLYE